jgi:hypothetical protein
MLLFGNVIGCAHANSKMLFDRNAIPVDKEITVKLPSRFTYIPTMSCDQGYIFELRLGRECMRRKRFRKATTMISAALEALCQYHDNSIANGICACWRI